MHRRDMAPFVVLPAGVPASVQDVDVLLHAQGRDRLTELGVVTWVGGITAPPGVAIQQAPGLSGAKARGEERREATADDNCVGAHVRRQFDMVLWQVA